MQVKTTIERTYVCECRDCGGMFYSSIDEDDQEIVCVGPTCMSDLIRIVDVKFKKVTIEANPKL